MPFTSPPVMFFFCSNHRPPHLRGFHEKVLPRVRGSCSSSQRRHWKIPLEKGVLLCVCCSMVCCVVCVCCSMGWHPHPLDLASQAIFVGFPVVTYHQKALLKCKGPERGCLAMNGGLVVKMRISVTTKQQQLVMTDKVRQVVSRHTGSYMNGDKLIRALPWSRVNPHPHIRRRNDTLSRHISTLFVMGFCPSPVLPPFLLSQPLPLFCSLPKKC